MNIRLQLFLESVKESGIDVAVSEPYSEEGVWFLDISNGDYLLVAQYSPSFGFGLSAEPSGISHKPHEVITSWEKAAARVKELVEARGLTIPTTTLPDLRAEKSQQTVASAMDVKQPSYAKMEGSPLASMQVATLEKIVAAMGAKLHLLVEAEGKYSFLSNSKKQKYSKVLDPSINSLPEETTHLHLMMTQFSRISSGKPSNFIDGKILHPDFRSSKERVQISSVNVGKSKAKVVFLFPTSFGDYSYCRTSLFERGVVCKATENYSVNNSVLEYSRPPRDL